MKHVLIVFKKEIIDMFRDKKTIISSILIPIIIFPLIYGFMGSSQKKVENDAEEKGIEIALESESQDISIVKYLSKVKKLKIIKTDDSQKALEKGTIKAIIFVGKDFDSAIMNGRPAPLTIQYDDSNQSSLMAAETIRNIVGSYSSSVIAQRLKERGIDPEILNPVDIKEKKTSEQKDNGGGVGLMIFSMLIPLMLAIYAASSVLPAATDNGAGEKERGTLEPLLSTQVNRLSLLMGKYLAITAAGIIGTFASMIGLFLAQKISPEILGEGGTFSIPMMLIVAMATICLTLIFAALELAISIYARSFKEAQTYLSPITILAMVPAFAVYMMDPKNIPLVYFNIPIANIICVIKELIAKVFNPLHIALGFGWAIVYIAISIYFAKEMFNKESVIFRV